MMRRNAGVTVVSKLQFAWEFTVSDSRPDSLGRLNSLSLFGCFERNSGFAENSGHSGWMPSSKAQLVQKARKLITEPRSANSTKQHTKGERHAQPGP